MSDQHDYDAWTGDDDREFGPDPDEGRCWSCGAREDEDCDLVECDCSQCIARRERLAKESA